jgi:hypothetical protein
MRVGASARPDRGRWHPRPDRCLRNLARPSRLASPQRPLRKTRNDKVADVRASGHLRRLLEINPEIANQTTILASGPTEAGSKC